jgi:hypothetical protein
MTKLGQLIETIKTGVKGSLEDIGKTKIPSIKIPYHYEEDSGKEGESPGAASGGLVTASGMIYHAGGGKIFAPRGSDTVPAMLTPGERVLSVADTRDYEKLLLAKNNLIDPPWSKWGPPPEIEIPPAPDWSPPWNDWPLPDPPWDKWDPPDIEIPPAPDWLPPWGDWTLPDPPWAEWDPPEIEIPSIPDISAPWEDWPEPPKFPEYAAQGGVVVSSGVQFLAKGGKTGFTPRGSDTIPAMLTPGERVLSVSQNRNYERSEVLNIPVNIDGTPIVELIIKRIGNRISVQGIKR